jgi:hypothetical protein
MATSLPGACPVEMPDVGHIEQAARLDLLRSLLQFARAGPGGPRRHRLANLVVGVLDLAEERVAAVREDVGGTLEGQVPARPDRAHPPPPTGRSTQPHGPAGLK